MATDRRLWIAAALGLVTFGCYGLVAGCGFRQLDGFAPLMPSDNFHVIEPDKAYRSAQIDSETLRLLIEVLGIKTVINLRGENEGDAWYDNEVAAADDLGVAHVDVRMSARELPPREELLLLYDTFLDAEYPILIHCRAGADRAGAASAIWRMVVEGDSKDAASRELRRLYGHFPRITPAMDELVAMFEPSRDWILNEYTP